MSAQRFQRRGARTVLSIEEVLSNLLGYCLPRGFTGGTWRVLASADRRNSYAFCGVSDGSVECSQFEEVGIAISNLVPSRGTALVFAGTQCLLV